MPNQHEENDENYLEEETPVKNLGKRRLLWILIFGFPVFFGLCRCFDNLVSVDPNTALF
uniref:Uncharacterized protein n=1 Tax=uncultured bacterium contig00069 TaxID=1181550 RepID=A0A806KLL2_9BACT|nr:hypothetical protein [uncultured bacterium contig00069]